MAETSPTVQQQLDKLRSRVDVADRHILHMQKVGGFTDSKAHGLRTTRIEDRVEALERDNKLLLDLVGIQMAMIEDHLQDRHGVNLVKDNDVDVVSFRKIKRRLREWAETCKLTKRGRSDIDEARRDENRLRPREAARS
jgi:hypothetical protein